MELFDKLGDTIVSVSKDATQKAKDISELARIRMEIRSKQDYLNKLFLEIGKIYYDAHKDDEEKEFKEQMLLVKDAQEILEELNQQLGQIKGMVKCTACGQDMPMDADYCSKCGTKLVKPKKEETAEADFVTEETDSVESEDAPTDDTVQEEVHAEAYETVKEVSEEAVVEEAVVIEKDVTE
ncbi:hypothetical protein C823_005572 [Eubacterium plexicaudatum ASF492]|uniref:Zinc-ribbon domain-containing protein n=1 Tax=Eubacterium plexicaudatum ASF492 TaxID=1235802 RepID=N2BAP3_9FIRM|nr:hypothetical protein C823_005572 [Eubacterium plexicaudatum ASF492]